MKRLTVIVPTRDEVTPAWMENNVTLRTLKSQTFEDFDVVVSCDAFKKGANWARNEGFKGVKTELVLFSDDDIEWKPFALAAMVATLDRHPEASYAYGAYLSNWKTPGKIYTVGNREFDGEQLRKYNYITTMSIIRTADFPGFDEKLERYQDWDIWLEMLRRGKVGVFCGRVLFQTHLAEGGISFGSIPTGQARAAIAAKHGL